MYTVADGLSCLTTNNQDRSVLHELRKTIDAVIESHGETEFIVSWGHHVTSYSFPQRYRQLLVQPGGVPKFSNTLLLRLMLDE